MGYFLLRDRWGASFLRPRSKMIGTPFFRSRQFWLFTIACSVPLLFALYTDHVWEDFYITFRSSKNLATGHGLVFNVGDRLHTFTSPLGVLLPALASLLTFNSSDTAALWVFRLMGTGAFGMAAVLLFETAHRLRFSTLAAGCLVGWLITDAKSVDFCINGMETPFMLAFFTYALWAMFSSSAKRWLHLGLAWGGLMWTRPDSFIYIALLSGGVWLFNNPDHTGFRRSEWFALFLRAAGVCTAIYLPWLIFAWTYYGTPVPHTITAKAALAGPKTITGFFTSLPDIARNLWAGRGPAPAAFLPSYAAVGDWPEVTAEIARWMGVVSALLWVVPWLRTVTKAVSLSFLGACLYLAYFPPFYYPWYLCLPALLGFIAIGGLLAQLLDAVGRLKRPVFSKLLRGGLAVLGLALIGLNLWLTFASAQQLKFRQEVIETGSRRKIGEWLRVHASPHDTVFLEPLGYVGYFSGLKTYDHPGLSSREVVNSIHRLGPGNWAALITDLHPDWLVLRPNEIFDIRKAQPQLLKDTYEPVQIFGVRDQLLKSTVRGKASLNYDNFFAVYRKSAPAKPPHSP